MEINRNTDPVFERQSTDKLQVPLLLSRHQLSPEVLWAHDTHSRVQPQKHPTATLDPSAAALGAPKAPNATPPISLQFSPPSF